MSSESCSFQSIGAKSVSTSVCFIIKGRVLDGDRLLCFTALRYYREVLPGEIVQLSKHGVKSLSVVPRPEGDIPAFCIFEYVYFARPDSIFEGLIILKGSLILQISHSQKSARLVAHTTVLQARWCTQCGSAVAGS